jgi:serine protease AprX
MKKFILSLILMCSALTFHTHCGATLLAAEPHNVAYPDGKFMLYRLSLTDKKGSAYSLKHPEKFLSAKALSRRSRQGLAVDSTDLPLSAKYISLLNEAGLHVVGGSKWNNTVIVRVPDHQTISKAADMPFVTRCVKVFSTPDSIKPMTPDAIVTDTASQKMHRSNPYGRGLTQIGMLNGTGLHQAGFQGEGMLIAVIDGGYMNVDKIGYLKKVHVAGIRDCVYPYTANVFSLLDHGTMVLSDMAADSDSLFVGTAPHAAYLLLRSEDGRTESLVEEDYWAQAVEYADSVGADVINSSLGYTLFDDTTTNHQYREQDGLTAINSRTASMIASKGMILVNSAGNEGLRPWKRINCPADARDILTVAALKSDSINATFSSVGPSIDGRVKPDVSSLGVSSTVIDGTGIITTANGTSFASPILCGMVACLWQALPGKTAYQIMDLVRRSGDRFDHPDNVFGYGVPDFWKAYQMGLKQ